MKPEHKKNKASIGTKQFDDIVENMHIQLGYYKALPVLGLLTYEREHQEGGGEE